MTPDTRELIRTGRALLNSLPSHWHDDATVDFKDALQAAERSLPKPGGCGSAWCREHGCFSIKNPHPFCGEPVAQATATSQDGTAADPTQASANATRPKARPTHD